MQMPGPYIIWHSLHVLPVPALFTMFNHCLIAMKASFPLVAFSLINFLPPQNSVQKQLLPRTPGTSPKVRTTVSSRTV